MAHSILRSETALTLTLLFTACSPQLGQITDATNPTAIVEPAPVSDDSTGWVTVPLTVTPVTPMTSDVTTEAELPDEPEPATEIAYAGALAPPGSKGGVCGVDYVNCPTEDSVIGTFQTLPRTNVAVTRQTKNLTLPTNSRKVSVKYRVPRLVDDRTSKYDTLEVISQASNATAEDGTADVKITFKRNSTTVGLFTFDRSGQLVTQDVDVYRGGYEAIMAFVVSPDSGTALTSRMGSELLGLPSPAGTVADTFCTTGNRSSGQKCFWCKVLKAGVEVIPGVAGGVFSAFSRLSRLSAAVIAGAAAAAGPISSTFVDCSKECGRAQCEENYCNGQISQSEYDSCCRMSGGQVTYQRTNVISGECHDISDLI